MRTNIPPGAWHACHGRYLPQKLTVAQSRFLEMFPDMQWAGDIYVMASGYCFDGRAQLIQGRSAVLFGVDVMVHFGEQELVPIMDHELFHRYHHDFFDFEGSSGYPLWTHFGRRVWRFMSRATLILGRANSISAWCLLGWSSKLPADKLHLQATSRSGLTRSMKPTRRSILTIPTAEILLSRREQVMNWASWWCRSCQSSIRSKPWPIGHNNRPSPKYAMSLLRLQLRIFLNDQTGLAWPHVARHGPLWVTSRPSPPSQRMSALRQR
jgi:hypothetical protein